MNAPVIRIADVTVRYGRRTAVDRVNLEVPTGSVYALLGRNGAGKSSLVRAILGLRKPDQGRVEVFGDDVWSRRQTLMDRVGIVSEDGDAPPEMKVRELAAFSARVYSRWRQDTFDARIRRFAIAPEARYGELSKGQKKYVSLALALAASPELLILDDPTLGLDVVARKSLFEEVITDLADRGITVLITTHDLGAIEAIADRVGVLVAGRLVLDEDVETLKARFRRIRVASQPAALSGAEWVTASLRQWGTGTEAVVSNYDDIAFARFREAARVSAEVTSMSLEEIFIAITGENEGASA